MVRGKKANEVRVNMYTNANEKGGASSSFSLWQQMVDN